MIDLTQLQNAAESALREAFSKSRSNAGDIEVYDHTEEIFDENFEGVAVWCDVNFKALSWFDGNPNFIINYSYELSEGTVDLFLGDECTDLDSAYDASDEFYCDDVWHIETVDDTFLMLQATFKLDSPYELQAVITQKLKALEDADFACAITPVIENYS